MRRNVWREHGCRCRNSWPQGRRNVSRDPDPRTRHEDLVVARPEMCEAGREEPFDEHTPWIFYAGRPRHSANPGNPGGGGNLENPRFVVETARVTKAPPAIRKDPVHIGRGMACQQKE